MFSIKGFEEFYKKKNGLLRYSDLIEFGLNQFQIRKLVGQEIIEKVGRGIYCHKDYFPDLLKVYQMENEKLIYSNETAAYLHGLTDRFPREFSVTTEAGYHLRKANEFKVYYVKGGVLCLGVVEVENSSGNVIKAYDKERTFCDIIKNKDRIELQVYVEVIQNYFVGKTNLNKLSKYAQKLGVSKKVSEIVALMIKP